MVDDKLTAIVYRVDEDDRLIHLNANWYQFAEANQAKELTNPAILNCSIWDFIVDSETRAIYEMLFAKVRISKEVVDFPFRCDTPTLRRFMRMELQPQPNDAILFTSRVTQVETRPCAYWLDMSLVRSETFVTICSWCKRVELPYGYWCEVEDAVETLGLFGTTHSPRLTHGMCPECSLSFRRSFA